MTRPSHHIGPINAPLALTGVTRTSLMVIALAVAPSGCRTPEPTHFGTITPGMTEREVLDRLGRPSSRIDAPDAGPPAGWATRWHWGDTLGTLATQATMPDQPPPPNVWTVWFNADGAVVAASPPSQTHNQAETAPWEPPPAPSR